MSLDRLTQKAKEVFNKVTDKKIVTSKTLITHIIEAGGMGKRLVEVVPPSSVKKTQKINLDDFIKEAFFQAIRLEHSYVGTEHLYLALLKMNGSKQLDTAKVELLKLGVFPSNVKQPVEADSSKSTPLLDAFGEDLNHRALKNYSTPLIYRNEYEKVISTLLLKEKSNALLVGEPGVGKDTIIKLLAHNFNALEVPPLLVGYHLRSLNVLSFMTSLANKGGIDYGIATLIEELKLLKKAVLVLENFQDIFFSTPAGLTIPIFYSIMKSYLDDAEVSLIASITPNMYEKIIAENDHVIDNFTVIEVDEPSEEETKQILKSNAKVLEEYHNVEVSDEIINYVYTKALVEMKTLRFPQKGMDLLDYACAYVIAKKSKIPQSYKKMVDESFDLAGELDEKLDEGLYEKALSVRDKMDALEKNLELKEKRIFKNNRKLKLTKKDIDDVLSELDVQESDVRDQKSLSKFGKLSIILKKNIIGQDEAIDMVSKALIRSKLGLRSKKRPLGNFLFLGPTGVGKTELAKMLAEKAFSKPDWPGLIRLDMSDFSEKHNVARLIGAPPGYVGYGEGGELTSKIDNHPASVVLFDEIEKAHPDVLNILLQIMEEGELSDARGTNYDFSKSVVILTSNLGTEILHSQGIGFEEKDIPDKKIESRLKENLRKILKPELLNRFDEVIVFKRLTKKNQMSILNLLLKEVTDTLAQQDVSLKIKLAVKRWLLEKGYSKEYGARALRRTIEKELLDKVAQTLLEKDKKPLKLTADLANNQIVIKLT